MASTPGRVCEGVSCGGARPVGLQILQSAVVVGLSPLYSGGMTRAEAVVASKRGPSIWQPYRDLGTDRSADRISGRADHARLGSGAVTLSRDPVIEYPHLAH